jgi:hypothetical protein
MVLAIAAATTHLDPSTNSTTRVMMVSNLDLLKKIQHNVDQQLK